MALWLWCHPVANALEARAVVTEAVQLRAQAGRAANWHEPELAQRLRHRADLLDAPPCRPALARLCCPRASDRGVTPERQRRDGKGLSLRGQRSAPPGGV